MACLVPRETLEYENEVAGPCYAPFTLSPKELRGGEINGEKSNSEEEFPIIDAHPKPEILNIF